MATDKKTCITIAEDKNNEIKPQDFKEEWQHTKSTKMKQHDFCKELRQTKNVETNNTISTTWNSGRQKMRG